MPQDITPGLDTLYRSDWGRIVATLIRLFGDFDAAEEAAQEAFAAAVDRWQTGQWKGRSAAASGGAAGEEA